MKNIISFLLILMFIFSISIGAFAVDANNDATIEKVYRITENGLQEVSIEEYLNFKEQKIDVTKEMQTQQQEVEISGITDDWYRYDESSVSAVRRTDLRERVSRIVDNTGSSEVAQIAVSYDQTVWSEIRGSLSSSEKSAVIGGVSVAWYNSLGVSDTYTLTVPAGKYGWWEFDPIMYKSTGYVKTFDWLGNLKSSKSVEAYTSKKLNGQADGYLVAKSSYYQPTN